MLFDNLDSLLRITVVGVLAYAALILLLRLSGNRTLSKMNAFDFVVTIALGSTLATILLSKSVTLADGVMAFVVLIGLQFLVTTFSVRMPWLQNIVTGKPVMLFHQGLYLSEDLKAARVTRDEIRAAIRNAGFLAMDEVDSVVLETDGSFSVIARAPRGGETDGSFSVVARAPRGGETSLPQVEVRSGEGHA